MTAPEHLDREQLSGTLAGTLRAIHALGSDPSALVADLRPTEGSAPVLDAGHALADAIANATESSPPDTTTPAAPTASLDEQCAAYPATDAGNALRLAARSGGQLIAITGNGWAQYDGTRWAPDDPESNFALKAALHTAEEIRTEPAILLAQDRPGKEATSRYKWHLDSQHVSRLAAMRTIARAHLAVPAADLDRDRDLLTTPTGTVDLRTGELKAHDPKDLITKIL